MYKQFVRHKLFHEKARTLAAAEGTTLGPLLNFPSPSALGCVP